MTAFGFVGLLTMLSRQPGSHLFFRDQRQLLHPEDRIVRHHAYYLDKLGEDPLQGFAISSAIIEHSSLEIFAAYPASYDRKLRQAGRHTLTDLFMLHLDDSLCRHLTWVPTSDRTRDGFTTVLPLRGVPDGLHRLQLRANVPNEVYARVTIPFWNVSR